MASAQGEAVWYPQVLVEPSSAVPVPINATARPRPAAKPGSAGAGPPRVSARNDRLAVSRRRPALRVFIYRRTHTGDPCRCGIFGVYDCMGRFRSRDFDAVLGVGVDSPDRGSEGIAGRLTWVGIGPCKHQSSDQHRAPNVTFDHFCLMDAKGPLLRERAPLLSTHMVRQRMSDSLPFEVQREVDVLVRRYQRCPGSRSAECRCQDPPCPSRPLTPRLVVRRSEKDQPGAPSRRSPSNRCR